MKYIKRINERNEIKLNANDENLCVLIVNMENQNKTFRKGDSYSLKEFYNKLEQFCRKSKSAGFDFNISDKDSGEFGVDIFSKIDYDGDYYVENTIYFKVCLCGIPVEYFEKGSFDYSTDWFDY